MRFTTSGFRVWILLQSLIVSSRARVCGQQQAKNKNIHTEDASLAVFWCTIERESLRRTPEETMKCVSACMCRALVCVCVGTMVVIEPGTEPANPGASTIHNLALNHSIIEATDPRGCRRWPYYDICNTHFHVNIISCSMCFLIPWTSCARPLNWARELHF